MSDALILCIETTTAKASVCITSDGLITREQLLLEEGDATSKITVAIDDLMKVNNIHLAQLKAIAVNIGPGSYTGLRLGLTVAKGLCFALGLPLITTSTFEYLSEASIMEYPHNDLHVVLVDARRSDSFCSINHKTKGVLPYEEFATINTGWFEAKELSNSVISGDFYQKITDEDIKRFSLRDSGYRQEAKHMVQTAIKKYQQGIFMDIHEVYPYYIKPPNITTPKDR